MTIMMHKIITASALSLALSTAALAQSSTTTTTGTATDAAGAVGTMTMTEADKSLTQDWKGPIGQAFFTDDTMATLRSQEEIKTGWAALSA
ncbi:MAG: hypothetical protein H0T56_02280, partial [Pseudaminobacter sp.]|nr:hypothetical protein [Pseudaminobacter sp.]